MSGRDGYSRSRRTVDNAVDFVKREIRKLTCAVQLKQLKRKTRGPALDHMFLIPEVLIKKKELRKRKKN